MADFAIVVTGSRRWRYPSLLRLAIRGAWIDAGKPAAALIHGAASGADRMAGDYARSLGMTVEACPADWAGPCVAGCPTGHRRSNRRGEYCPHAGHRRNQHMVDLRPDVVLAFWRDHSTGTADCIRRAEKAGLTVLPTYDCACHEVPGARST